MEGCVYILQSEQHGKYYTGSSGDVAKRVMQHNAGKTKATRNGRPWKLIFVKRYSTIRYARQIEYKLKRGKSKKILEQIIHDQDIIMGP